MALTPYQKHVQSEMKKGKSMKQAASSWKSKKKGNSSKRKTNSSNNKGGKKSVSKGGFNTQKIFKYVRLAALAAPAAGIALTTATPEAKLKEGLKIYTGYDIDNKTFRFDKLAQGWLPFLGASVATYGIPKLTAMLRSF